MAGIICVILQVTFWAIIVRIILDWVRVPDEHPVGRLRSVLAGLTDPLLRPLRQLIPPIRTGTVALDLSPLVLLVGLQLLMAFVC